MWEIERRPGYATLRAVQLTVIGLLTEPGASAVKLAGEEQRSEGGLVFNQNMEGDRVRESRETEKFATLGAVP